ncbi:hypothetical protein [Streptomyces sp. NPDC058701]|uniref:hypothetical protein n=1 Tax=Streptomyces sp. NPDC058701 TaxID=3346608 RepID=UPI003650ECE9
MGNEVLVGVIGLGGTIVGASAAFLGVVYQQRHQARLAQAQRRDSMAIAAADTLLTELESLSKIAWRRPDDGSPRDEAFRQWTAEMGECVGRIQLAVLRLPHPELREAIESACLFEFGNEVHFQQVVGLRAGRILMNAMCRDAQRCLGAYLRQEPIPSTEFLSRAHREREAIRTWRPEPPSDWAAQPDAQ